MTRRKDYRGVAHYYRLNLQRFADSGEGTQAAAGTGESTEQVAAANTETKVSFEDLIKGEYREDYEKSIKQAIGRRMQGARQNEAKLAKMSPIMQALASKYGTDPEDIDSIARYVDEDESLYEDAAYRAGMSVDQYKRFSQIEAENQRLMAERQRNEQRRAAEAQYAIWQEEAEAVKADFPNFELDVFLQDPHFQTLLKEGISLRNAYIAMDADNVLPEVMGYTAKEAAKKTATAIAQRGNRPSEGGMNSQAAIRVKTDVSKLTDAEFDDLVQRVKRGEVISPYR